MVCINLHLFTDNKSTLNQTVVNPGELTRRGYLFYDLWYRIRIGTICRRLVL